MRILVTGAAGYVGGIVCRRLAAEHEVIGFDQRLPEQPCCRCVRGDILNSSHLIDAMRGVEAVVHLAAIPNLNADLTDTVMEVNVIGTQRVVQAAALGSPRRLVLASSDATYGFVFGQGQILPEYLPVDERHPLRPRDSYGLSKLIKEEICRRYTRDTGLETVCLRYCWVWCEREYEALGHLAKDPGAFVGQLWGYLDVRDVAQGVERALVTPGLKHETLLLSAASTFQSTFSAQLVECFLPQARLREPGWFDDNPYRSLLDWRRAHEVIGFEPEYDCWDEAGLQR